MKGFQFSDSYVADGLSGDFKGYNLQRAFLLTRKRHLQDSSSPERQKKASKANVSWMKCYDVKILNLE